MSLTIGADPEFSIIDSDGKLVHANLVISGGVTEGAVGVDPSGKPAEIRPKHTDNPMELVDNVRSALQSMAYNFPYLQCFEWRAGAHVQWPLGGHIHLGYKPSDYTKFAMYVAAHVAYPLALCDVDGMTRRRTLSVQSSTGPKVYGVNLFDHHTPPHGIEIRSPLSWLGSPKIAAAALCGAYVAAKSYGTNKQLNRDAVEAVVQHWPVLTLGAMPAVIKSFEIMPMYQEYSHQIDLMLDLGCNNPAPDMKQTWNIKVKPLLVRRTANV